MGRDRSVRLSLRHVERCVVEEWQRIHLLGSNLIVPGEALPAQAQAVPREPIEI